MLHKDTIKKLRDQLQAEHDTHLSNASAAKGALQLCDHLLSLPDAEPEKCTAEDCPKEDAAA